jgi:hypothetical protein
MIRTHHQKEMDEGIHPYHGDMAVLMCHTDYHMLDHYKDNNNNNNTE